MKEEALNLLPFAIKVIKYIFNSENKDDWKTIVNTAVRLNVNKEDFERIFDNKAINKLIKNLKDNPGFELKEDLTNGFNEILVNSNLSSELKSYLVDSVVTIILNKVKEDYPTVYSNYLLQEIHNEISLKNDKKVLFDIDSIDADIQSSSNKKYRLSLDYYELDDPDAENLIKQKISENSDIYINYYCPTEALFRILNFLRNNGYSNVIVATSIDAWSKIRESKIKKQILIPFFAYEELRIIDDNINILIDDGNTYHEYNSNPILLRKRTRQNISHSLINIVKVETGEAYQIVKETNGLFVPLQMKLTSGVVDVRLRYNIDKEDIENVLYLFLINEWNDKDIETIETVFEIPDVEAVFKKYSIGANPLFIKSSHRYNGSIYYKVAFYQAAWQQLDKLLTKKQIIKFIDYVLNTIKNYPEYGISDGIYKSLTYVFYYRDQSTKKYIHDKFASLLEHVDTIDEYKRQYGLFDKFVDIVPDVIIDLFEKLIKKDAEAFSDELKIYHYDLGWTLQKLIQNSLYTERALYLTANIYKYNERIKPTLLEAFCAWYNMLPNDCKNKKVKIAESIISSNDKFWNIIYDNLPAANMSIVNSWAEPGFIDERIEHKVAQQDYVDTVIGYLRICINNMSTNVERISDLLRIINYYDDEYYEIFVSELKQKEKSMTDVERARLCYKIHRRIFDVRYFEKSWGKVNQARIDKLIDVIDGLKYKYPEYAHYYLFINDYDGVILNPFKFEEEDHRKNNNDLVNQERIEIIKRYAAGEFDLERLISILCNETSTNLGEYIASVIDGGLFSKKTINLIIKNDKSKYRNVLKRYCFAIAGCGFKQYSLMMKFIKSIKIPNIVYLTALESFRDYIDDLIPIISSCPENIKKEFWSKRRIYSNKITRIGMEYILDSTIIYGNKATYIDYLSSLLNLMDYQYVFNRLMQVVGCSGDFESIDGYDMETILEQISPLLFEDNDNKKICDIELQFRNKLGWDKLKFTQYCFAKYPEYYAKTIVSTFKTNGTGLRKYIDNRFDYSFYYSVSFCPGFINNHFDNDLFDKWVDGFKAILDECGIEDMFDDSIGRMLPFSPFDSDGISPLIHIRDFIEKRKSKDLRIAFIVTECNKRGAYALSAGSTERQISNDYKQKADILKESGYTECALIYYDLAKDYGWQSNLERERAEDE